MRVIITMLFCVFFTSSLWCQDTIKVVEGELIIAKVKEINEKEITYKKFTNINGPLYIVNKKDVISIAYQNGETEIFNKIVISETSNNEDDYEELFK